MMGGFRRERRIATESVGPERSALSVILNPRFRAQPLHLEFRTNLVNFPTYITTKPAREASLGVDCL